jgi:catechol 2,3-dioxygenase-like lactoylglutathione lyase family enzyme
MRLNHLNLTVTDVPAASAFLERYFGLRRTGGNAGMAFLTDDDGFVLSLMKVGRAASVAYPSTFHIGFSVASEDQVDAPFMSPLRAASPSRWRREHACRHGGAIVARSLALA